MSEQQDKNEQPTPEEIETYKRAYADDPFTLAQVLAIAEGRSKGDMVPLNEDGSEPPRADDEETRGD
jgi:hypothetical protein